MKSDIEIAQEAELVHIKKVAEKLGINEDELEFYGKYKAKISDELWESVKDREDGKLVLVTAINPTPAGEGKTTTSIGLGEAMALLGKKAPPLHWEVKEDPKDDSIFYNILTKIKDKFAFLFDRDCFT